jgi:hypothetical protein
VVRTHCLARAEKAGTGDLLGRGLGGPGSDSESCEGDEGGAGSDRSDGRGGCPAPPDGAWAGWQAGTGSTCWGGSDGGSDWGDVRDGGDRGAAWGWAGWETAGEWPWLGGDERSSAHDGGDGDLGCRREEGAGGPVVAEGGWGSEAGLEGHVGGGADCCNAGQLVDLLLHGAAWGCGEAESWP